MNDGRQTIDYGPRRKVLVLHDAEALAQAAAALVAETTIDAVALRGRSTIALSGGSTPKRMGELLAEAPFRDRLPWDRLHFFWGDERWVPLDDPESNAGTAKRTFLDHVPLPPNNVHPFPTHLSSAHAAAVAYQDEIASTLSGGGGTPPRFELILLGMGDDGHTASLFPGTDALHERESFAVANPVPKLGTTRLTLTLPILNAGRTVAVLVGGAGKAEILAAVLDGPEHPDDLPVQSIRPIDGALRWLVDRAAAKLLAAARPADG